MNKRITDMLFLPYPGSPFTVHITYNYGQKPKNLIPLTPISSVTIPFPTQSTTPASQNDQRLRAVFNREQIAALEDAFRRNNFLPKERRCELARRIGLEEKQVKDWFQNRRVKAKRNQEILTHYEEATENEVDENYAACSFAEPRMRREKEDAINQIVMFLEGSADTNIDRIVMPPLNVLPQMPRTIQTCLCADDLDDLLDVLKKEARETYDTQTSLISQLKRRKTDDHEDVPPPPEKKKRIEIPDQSWFYLQHLH